MDNYVRVSYFILIFTLRHTVKVYGTGVFEVRIEEFKNDNGRNAQNRCCDDSVRTIQSRACGHQCRTAFEVCLSPHESHTGCKFGSSRSPILGGNSFEFDENNMYADNTIRTAINFTWMGAFSLRIEAYHVVGKRTPGPSIVRMRKYESKLKPGSGWRTETQIQQGRTLRFSYRVLCDEFYYGFGCSTFCKPRNDRFGHWKCNGEGQKVCLSGWESEPQDDYCLKPICRSGCSLDHGYCKQPDDCECRSGWRGSLCDKCMVDPRCRHGTCNKSFDCLCKQGWGGLFCTLDLNYCVHHGPCRNGATCRNSGLGSFTCECRPGFYGKRCEHVTKVCASNPCLNGGTCKASKGGFTCECLKGFSGSRCEDATCGDNPCRNGGSCLPAEQGFVCACRHGYRGSTCEEIDYGCDQVVCLNGGTCAITSNGTRCICPSGFAGASCQNVLPQCTKDCHHGTCVRRGDVSECECSKGYVGDRCEFQDPCRNKPCLNEGVCKNKETDKYACLCPGGYGGSNCENAGDTNAKAQIILFPKDESDLSQTQGIAVGLLSVLIVMLIIGLVICLTYPAKKRNGYFRGMLKRQRKARDSPPVVDNTQSDSPAVQSEISDSEEEHINLSVDVEPEKVKYRSARPSGEGIRVSLPRAANLSQTKDTRYDPSLPSYQEACGAIRSGPSLV